MIKIGILGAARIALTAMITPVSLRDDCEITVVACRDAANGEAFAQEHNIPSVETRYEAMMARDDIDLIYNALPPSRHADLSIAAVKAGKSVLCEKPFAMNAKEVKLMTEAAKKTGLPIIEAFHYRFHPAFSKMLEIIKAGEIGTVENIEAIFDAAITYREGELRYGFALGGGALMDLGCYCVHWARMVVGSEPKVVKAECIQHLTNVDLTTQAELLFNENVKAIIKCSMDEEKPKRVELTVWGSRGKLHFNNPLAPHSGYQITVDNDAGIRTENENIVGTTYDFQLAHMIDVLKGNVMAITGQSDALANMVVIDSIYHLGGLPAR